MSTVVYGAAVALLSLQGLIVLPLFTQSLGAAEYGVFNQLRVSIALLSPILLLQFDAAAVRFLAGETEPTRFRNIFLTPLAVVVPGTITLALLAPLGAEWAARLILDDPARRDVVVLLGPWLVAHVLAAYFLNYFRIVGRVDTVAFLMLAQGVCSTVAIVVTVTVGYGVYGVIASMAMVDGLFAVGYAVAVWRRIHVTTPPQLSQLRPLLQYALPLIPTVVMVWLIDYSDRIFIVHLLGPGAVGTYSASYFLGRLVTVLSGPLHFTLFPHVTRHHEAGRTATVRAYLSNGNLYFLMIAIPATIGIALLSSPPWRCSPPRNS